MSSKYSLDFADVILNGKKVVNTEYGRKTREGIADLFQRQAQELAVAAATYALIDLISAHEGPEHHHYREGVYRTGAAILAKMSGLPAADRPAVETALYDCLRKVVPYYGVKLESTIDGIIRYIQEEMNRQSA